MGAPIRTKAEKIYLLEFNDGKRQRITIPEGCKITFGALQFSQQQDRYGNVKGGTGGHALRVYEGGEGVQLAVFRDVKHFRDLTTIKTEVLELGDEGLPNWREDVGEDFGEQIKDVLSGKRFSNHSGNLLCPTCNYGNNKSSEYCENCGQDLG